MAGLIEQTPDSIGYIELIYADAEQDRLRAREEFLRRVCEGGAGQRFRRCRGGVESNAG